MNIDGVCLPRGRQGRHELGPNREMAGQRDKAPALACLRMPLPVGMHRIIPRRLLAALIAGSFGLAGCSAMIADHTPTALGGLPEGAPQRSARPSAYPAVHDMPPRRGSVVLTDTEQKKLEDDLIAARNRTATKSKAVDAPD